MEIIDKSNKMYYKQNDLSTFYCLNFVYIQNFFQAFRQNFKNKIKNQIRKK